MSDLKISKQIGGENTEFLTYLVERIKVPSWKTWLISHIPLSIPDLTALFLKQDEKQGSQNIGAKGKTQ
jgi:hypothetical protein